MNIVKALLEYTETGESSISEIRSAERVIGAERFRILAIKLLGWMKSQHRHGRVRPLPLKKDYAWCDDA